MLTRGSVFAEYNDLIHGADEGAYSLPPEVVTARRGVDAVSERWRALPGQPRDPSAEAAAMDRGIAMAAEVVTSGELPSLDADLDAIAAHRLAFQRWSDEQMILTTMREHAAAEFAGVVMAHADAIVLDHLRPAFNEVIAALSKAAPRLVGQNLDDGRTWVNADAPSRAAYRTLDEVLPRLGLIRRAHDAVLGKGRGDSSRFSWLRNIDALRPNWKVGAPWPEDVRERAIWLVTSEAEPWLPTADEERAAWLAAEARLAALRPPTLMGGVTTERPRNPQRPDIHIKTRGGVPIGRQIIPGQQPPPES